MVDCAWGWMARGSGRCTSAVSVSLVSVRSRRSGEQWDSRAKRQRSTACVCVCVCVLYSRDLLIWIDFTLHSFLPCRFLLPPLLSLDQTPFHYLSRPPRSPSLRPQMCLYPSRHPFSLFYILMMLQVRVSKIRPANITLPQTWTDICLLFFSLLS